MSAPDVAEIAPSDDVAASAPKGSLEPDRHGSRVARRGAAGAGLVVILLLGVLVWGVAKGPRSTRVTLRSALDGKPAPALVGKTLAGPRFDLNRFGGSWVVVNFFATWCPPCIAEHSELVTFSQRHAAVGDRLVVSVVFDDVPSLVSDFFDRKGGSWPVLLDDGDAAVNWAVTAVPESILVDPNGVVRGKIKGGIRADQLDRLIDEAEVSDDAARAGRGTSPKSGASKLTR